MMVKIEVIGRLGRDAQVNNVNNKVVINFSVAVTEKYKKQDGTQAEDTTWLNCSYWTERTAIAAYLKKGGIVYVEGKPEAKIYTHNNQPVASLNVRVSNIKLLPSSENSQQQQQQPQESQDLKEPLDDLPF